MLWFKQGGDIHFLYLKISDSTQPLSRKYFTQTHAGAVLLNKHDIIRVEEIDYKKIDKWLDECTSLTITGVDEGSIAFLDERIQKLKFL